MKTVLLEKSLITFRLDDQLHALPVSKVKRIFRIVEITAAPGAHPALMGFINIQGQVVPVVNTRALFGIRMREIDLSDQLILVCASRRLAALWVDGGTDIIYLDSIPIMEENTSAAKATVLQTASGLIYLHEVDLELQFLEEIDAKEFKHCIQSEK